MIIQIITVWAWDEVQEEDKALGNQVAVAFSHYADNKWLYRSWSHLASFDSLRECMKDKGEMKQWVSNCKWIIWKPFEASEGCQILKDESISCSYGADVIVVTVIERVKWKRWSYTTLPIKIVSQKRFSVSREIAEVGAAIKHLKDAVVWFYHIPFWVACLANIKVRWVMEMLLQT